MNVWRRLNASRKHQLEKENIYLQEGKGEKGFEKIIGKVMRAMFSSRS